MEEKEQTREFVIGDTIKRLDTALETLVKIENKVMTILIVIDEDQTCGLSPKIASEKSESRPLIATEGLRHALDTRSLQLLDKLKELLPTLVKIEDRLVAS